MQSKGLITFFLALLVGACIYALSFTFLAKNFESKAQAHAESIVAQGTPNTSFLIKQEKKKYLRDKGDENLFLGYTYNDCAAKQLNLGLDLQGGMSVVLQVSLEELITSMSNGNTNPIFIESLAAARAAQKDSQEDFVTLFGEAFKQKAPEGARLAGLFGASPEYADRITPTSNDDEVLAVVREEANEAIKRTFEILRTRIDKFGVSQPNVSLQENTGRIIVELPGVDDAARVRKNLQATANLEFWEMYEMSNELGSYLESANTSLKNKLGISATPDAPIADEITEVGAEVVDNVLNEASDALNLDEDSTSLNTDDVAGELGEGDLAAFDAENPFYAVFRPVAQIGSPIIGHVAIKDTAAYNAYMKMPEIRGAFPNNIKLLFGTAASDYYEQVDEAEPVLPVYAVQSQFADGKPSMDGGVITSADFNTNFEQQVVVNMAMDNEGAKQWYKMTKENSGQCVGVVLDDVVYSAPRVNEPIAGGRTQISGNFTMEEASDLATIIKVGKLPAPARIVQEESVGPTLGAESIRAGLLSLLVGLALVMVFMIFYYAKGGVVAVISLLANILFIIGILASLGATLTLPGMAGIVLTIGMAVDANVIIFERIREELARGSSMRKAVADGYSKSYSAIIDANLTTLITAIILAVFGLGPVLGFATVLIIGIFSSLFTAVLLSRLMVDRWMKDGDDNISFSTAFSANRFKDLNIDFISKKKISYVVSGALIALGLFSMVTRGFDYGVDFEGGRSYMVRFDKPVSTEDLASALSGPLEAAPLVRTYGADNQVMITSSYKIGSDNTTVDDEIENTIYENVKSFFAAAPSKADFLANHKMGYSKVGPTIADDITNGAKKATIFALLGIFFYILARFRKWTYGVAAVITIIHDTLVLLAIFSLLKGILPFSLEINQNFIAALLTVIGYSINDTVVVFDRIREYLGLYPKKDYTETVNAAVNSTLSRTIITSLTTLIVVFILFAFGGEVTRGFAFALLIGIIVGTYSSIFIATPIVVDLTTRIKNKTGSVVRNVGTRSKKAVS